MRHWGVRWHPARLVAELALQEEGVGVDHTVNRPWKLSRFSAVAVWMRPRIFLTRVAVGARVAPREPQVHLDALHDVGPLRSMRFGLLGPEAHEQEEVGEAVEGGVCEVREVHAVEVVDIVAAHEEEQGAGGTGARRPPR